MTGRDHAVAASFVPPHGLIESSGEHLVGCDALIGLGDTAGSLETADATRGKWTCQPVRRREGGPIVEDRWHFRDDGQPEVTSTFDAYDGPHGPLELCLNDRAVIHRQRGHDR